MAGGAGAALPRRQRGRRRSHVGPGGNQRVRARVPVGDQPSRRFVPSVRRLGGVRADGQNIACRREVQRAVPFDESFPRPPRARIGRGVTVCGRSVSTSTWIPGGRASPPGAHPHECSGVSRRVDGAGAYRYFGCVVASSPARSRCGSTSGSCATGSRAVWSSVCSMCSWRRCAVRRRAGGRGLPGARALKDRGPRHPVDRRARRAPPRWWRRLRGAADETACAARPFPAPPTPTHPPRCGCPAVRYPRRAGRRRRTRPTSAPRSATRPIGPPHERSGRRSDRLPRANSMSATRVTRLDRTLAVEIHEREQIRVISSRRVSVSSGATMPSRSRPGRLRRT